MKPKVLLLDIETSPILSHVWGLFDQNVGLNQIKSDWHLLSWAAKWLDDKKIMYQDQRSQKNIEDDSKILKGIWSLLNEADIVITQNGISFDCKKLNARFVLNGMSPPSSYRHIDTLRLAKKHFAFTSNKLEFMTSKLCTKYKKQQHKKYPGFELWSECLKGNKSAWREMEKYNKYDVLALEELYHKLQPWDNTIDFSVYSDDLNSVCQCGNDIFYRDGFSYTAGGKYQRYECSKCRAKTQDKVNLLNKAKRLTLRKSA